MGPEKMFGLAETLPVWKVMFIQDKYIHSTQEKTRKKEGKRERKKERKKEYEKIGKTEEKKRTRTLHMHP